MLRSLLHFGIIIMMVIVALPWVLILLTPAMIFLSPLGVLAIVIVKMKKIIPHKKMQVLVIDDDFTSVGPLVSALTVKATEVTLTDTSENAWHALQKKTFDFIFLDYALSDGTGEDFLRHQEIETNIEPNQKTPVAFYSGYPEDDRDLNKKKYNRYNVVGFINKDTNYKNLSEQIEQLFPAAM